MFEIYLQYENPSFIDTLCRWTRINTFLGIKRLIVCQYVTYWISLRYYVPTSATPSPSLSRSLSAWSGIPSPSSSMSSSSGVPSLSSSWSSKLKQIYAIGYCEDMKLDSKCKEVKYYFITNSCVKCLTVWPW